MLVLGLHPWMKNTSAALVEDGKLLFAAEEERFTGIKACGDFPINAIQACFKYANVNLSDVDIVSVSLDPFEQVRLKFIKHWYEFFPHANERMLAEFEAVQGTLNIENELRDSLKYDGEIYYCRHHKAHMASAYYLSDFNESALFSIDGVGEIESSLAGMTQGNSLKVFEEDCRNEWPDSMGSLYTAITDYLGFYPHTDEGKVMGLAPYGDANKFKRLFEDIVLFQDKGRFKFDYSYLDFPFKRRSNVSEKFKSIIGPKRNKNDELTQIHKDVAAGIQYITEKVFLHSAEHIYSITKNKNLCLAGGVALNCVANGKILYDTPFENIFVQPAANDAGCAIGAAMYYYYLNNPDADRYPINTSYLGDEFSDKEILIELQNNKVNFIESENVASEVSQYLAQGKIIGWFNGRMEFGPRALGNRSILTAPFPADMKDILNDKVKHREGFRPFAPVVRLDECDKYFDNEHESPYMLLVYNVREQYRDKIPAITHVDGTARVQTVTEDQNPRLYELITEFEKLTDIGVILNTSFNVMGQPIVNNPKQAIECFLSTHMDYLVLNAKYIVTR